MLLDRTSYSCVSFCGVNLTFPAGLRRLRCESYGYARKMRNFDGKTRGLPNTRLHVSRAGCFRCRGMREDGKALTIITSSSPILALSPAPPSTVCMPSSSSSSASSTATATFLASIVFLTFELLLSFGVLSQYSLLLGNFLRITLYPDGRLGQLGWPAGVCFLAVLAIGTEASEVKLAKSLPNMFFRAIRSERAESFFIVWTRRKFFRGVNVQVKAFLTIRTIPIPNKKVTFRHLPQVELV